jgi:diadenosine tetraphosphate (Ap4A) HIT family hydrolase
MAETLFQRVFREYDEWEANDRTGKIPARVAFRHRDVSALVDPFRKLPGTIVVIPKEGTPGREQHLAHLPSTRLMQVALVCQAFGQKIVEQTGLRSIEHTEGYGVPDHAHTVIFAAERGEGRALYEKVDLPEPEILNTELDDTLERLAIVGVEAVLLRRKLDLIDSASPLFDDYPPGGVVSGLRTFADRVTLTT